MVGSGMASFFGLALFNKQKVEQEILAQQAELHHKLIQEQESKTLSLLQLLDAVTDVVGHSDNLNHSISLALEYICQYSQWPIGHAYLVDRQQQVTTAKTCGSWYIAPQIDSKDIAEFKNISEQTTFISGKGLIGKVLQSKNSISIDDVTVLSGFVRAASAKKNHVHGCFAFPILDSQSGEVRAILEFFNYEKTDIDDVTLRVTDFIGKQITLAFNHFDNILHKEKLAEMFELEVKGAVHNIISSLSDMADSSSELQAAIVNIESECDRTKQNIENSLSRLSSANQNSELLQMSTEQIQTIANIIGNIASNTNLLALNAAIEAARAGESGRGFAVVANEVKELSGQTTDSTQKVHVMVSDIKQVSSDIEQAIMQSNDSLIQVDQGSILVKDAIEEQRQKTQLVMSATELLASQLRSLEAQVNQFLTKITAS